MEIRSIADISLHDIEKVIKKGKISEITIIDPESYSIGMVYDIETLKMIKHSVLDFLRGCPNREKNVSEKEIFTYIYTKLAYRVNYDKLASDIKDSNPHFRSYAYDFLRAASGLEGAMISGSALCSGFSETLRNLLAEVGIESKVVSGKVIRKNGDVGHAWNQVKLDGEWYNCDLTHDREFILQGLVAPKFLKSNNEFPNYKRYPIFDRSSLNESNKSVSSDEQQRLIETYREQILRELKIIDGKVSRAQGYIELILEKLNQLKNRQYGENYNG